MKHLAGFVLIMVTCSIGICMSDNADRAVKAREIVLNQHRVIKAIRRVDALCHIATQPAATRP